MSELERIAEAKQIARGIKMLGLLRTEDPNWAIYNGAINAAAAYVEQVWCQEGRGARAPVTSDEGAVIGAKRR